MISILCDSAVYKMQQKNKMCKESILFTYWLFNDVKPTDYIMLHGKMACKYRIMKETEMVTDWSR
jgi:hypothetical protein